jgi:hypothetical protein
VPLHLQLVHLPEELLEQFAPFRAVCAENESDARAKAIDKLRLRGLKVA